MDVILLSNPEPNPGLRDRCRLTPVDGRNLLGGLNHFGVVTRHRTVGKMDAILESDPHEIAAHCQPKRGDAEHVASRGRHASDSLGEHSQPFVNVEDHVASDRRRRAEASSVEEP